MAMQNTHAISPVSTVLAQLAAKRRQEALQLQASCRRRGVRHRTLCEKVAATWPVLYQTNQAEVDTANAQIRLYKQEEQIAFPQLPIRESYQVAVCGFTIADVRLTRMVCAYTANITPQALQGLTGNVRGLIRLHRCVRP